MILDIARFIANRRPLWKEYEALLHSMTEVNGFRLNLEQIKRLRFLQDAVSADLIKLRTFASDPVTTEYLESLVARGFGVIHENRTGARLRFNLVGFLVEFATTVRRHSGALFFVIAVMGIGAVFGMGVIYLNPEAKEVLMPFGHLLGDPSERVAMEESQGGQHLSDGQASFSAYLMANNIRVSIFVLALGLLFGVFSTVLLFYNGVMLGAVVMDYILAGESVFLVGWLLPHGSVEIPSIVFAGQAGMLLAQAVLVKDGRLSLSARLKKQSRDVVTLIGGVAILLIWAGLIESFFSQYHEPVIPYLVKIAFGMIQFVGLALFIAFAGGKRKGTVQ